MTIRSRLISFLICTLILFSAYAYFAYSGLITLENLTNTIYEHPLQVSNAALNAKIDILKIHRSMRRVTRTQEVIKLHEIQQDIRRDEAEFYTNLDIIRARILGDQGKELEKNAREQFHKWKEIRDEIMALAMEQKWEESNNLNRVQGDAPVASLEERMRELTNYARNKADGFIKDAAREEQRLNQYTILYALVLIAVTLLAAIAIIGNISANLRLLQRTMLEIVETGELQYARLKGSNELTELADTFNKLLDKLQMQLWLRQGFNGLNDELSGLKNLQEVSERALSYLARYMGGCVGACYQWDKDARECRLLASYAYVERTYLSARYKPGEGVVGQVALEQKPILLEHIQEEDALARTGTTSGPPRNIYAFPLLCDGELEGVMELGSFEPMDPFKREFLDQSGRLVGYVLHATSQSVAIKLLLAETREANTALEIRSAELDSLNSRLGKANVELENQSKALKSQSTELRVQKNELEVKRAQVEEADRLKSEFLSNMSHELRTPLNSILALSQLMINRGTGQDLNKEKQYLEIMERNGQHLLSLINDILDLTKIESGRMEIYPEPFSVNELLEECLQTTLPVARNKGVDVVKVLENDFRMVSDRGKISQILLNLVSNGVKFTEQGRVTITVRNTPDQVEFRVQDTGVGIEAAEQSLVFDEFRQVDGSTTRRHEGTGLGLAISRKLARLLGGDITLESARGKGSTFTLVLPAKLSDTLPSGPMSAVEPSKYGSAPLEKTILIIDDEKEVCGLMQMHLEQAGFNVVSTTSPEKGVELARQLKPYAITLDLLMPEQDGWEVINKLKADPETAGIPVIIVSVSDERDTGVALGASGYLLKPVDPERLLTLLREVALDRPEGRILVVDDDPAITASLKDLLLEQGYAVRTAANGKEALESLAKDPADVVLIDLVMPEMDGFELIKQIRENPDNENTSLVVLTAKDLSKDECEQLSKSVRNVMRKKPGNGQEVLAQINEALLQISSQSASETNARPLIVIIEDNSVAALQMKVLLADHGYIPHVILESANAMPIMQQLKPDGVILDLMMPEVDGFEILESIRFHYPDGQIPVLVLTAKDLTESDRERLQSLNVRYLVQKGAMVREQLLRTIDKVFKPQAKPDIAAISAISDSAPILLVEDNSDNLVTLSAILEDAKIPFLVARDGQEAVSMASQHSLSLILMDIQLPGLSGLEATQAIKANPALAGIPIIAMTAKAMRGDRESILQAGCDDYLSKPVNPETFVSMVRKWRQSFSGHSE